MFNLLNEVELSYGLTLLIQTTSSHQNYLFYVYVKELNPTELVD